jgi:hypothetical protein
MLDVLWDETIESGSEVAGSLHHHLSAGLLILMQDCTLLRRCLVFDRPSTSEFMCNLYGTPDEKHTNLSSLRLISNAYEINFGATNNPFLPLLNSHFFQVESACSSSSSCRAASLAWAKGPTTLSYSTHSIQLLG